MIEWKLPLELQLADARQIRSFVTRQGRLTKGQRAALDELWPTIGLNLETFDFNAVVAGYQQRVLEIGFGNGESLATMAEQNPTTLFFGIEVHQPGVGALLAQIQERNIDNIRLFYADARDVLARAIPPQSLDRVQVYFPDPWPKTRHKKRRIIQGPFITTLLLLLRKEGVIHTATDWQPYAQHMLKVLSAEPGLVNTNPNPTALDQRPEYRPETKFEKRGHGLGHDVWDFVFQKREG